MRKKKKKLRGIGGWLLIILFICIISWITNFILFVQISTLIRTQTVEIFISAFFLLAYLFLMGSTIFMILAKKKSATKLFIISIIIGAIFLIWHYLIVPLIYLSKKIVIFPNLLTIIINITITILIIFYLIKSKRVKNTFRK